MKTNIERKLALRKQYLFHFYLVQRGYFKSAWKLLRGIRNGEIFISDGDDESYESGLAFFLQDHFKFSNSKYGFRAYLR